MISQFASDNKVIQKDRTVAKQKESIRAAMPMYSKAIDRGFEVLSSSADEVARKSISSLIWDEEEVVVNCGEEFRRTTKRLKRALERMRAKGFCKRSGFLYEAMDNTDGLGYEPFVYSIAAAVPLHLALSGQKEELLTDTIISDDTWLAAIEAVLVTTEPQLMKDQDASLAIKAVAHAPEIYVFAGLMHVLEQSRKMFPSPDRGYAQMERDWDDAQAEIETKNGELKEANDKIRSLETRLDLMEKRADELAGKNSELQKQLNARDRELRSLRATDDEPGPQEAEDEDVGELYGDPVTESDLADESLRQLYELDPLPEDGTVIILGGAKPFVDRMKARHPDWRYVNSDDTSAAGVACMPGSKITCVMFCGKVSHKVTMRITEKMPDSTPMFRIRATNVDLAEQLIQYHWVLHRIKTAGEG